MEHGAPDKTVASSITQTKQLRLEKHDFGLVLLTFFIIFCTVLVMLIYTLELELFEYMTSLSTEDFMSIIQCNVIETMYMSFTTDTYGRQDRPSLLSLGCLPEK